MKISTSLLVLLISASAVHADVFTKVCLSDDNTPLALADPCILHVYRPIMVGTHLTIIISSTTYGYWTGGELSLWDANQNYGYLFDCSILPAAGENAMFWSWNVTETVDGQEHDPNGFQFSGDDESMPGDWFLIDYEATSQGNCSAVFYNFDVDGEHPLYEINFTHVSTRDFNDDGIVNFEDFAIFGSNWRRTDCSEPDNCSGTNLDNSNGHVDINDLMQFTEYWLEKTR